MLRSAGFPVRSSVQWGQGTEILGIVRLSGVASDWKVRAPALFQRPMGAGDTEILGIVRLSGVAADRKVRAPAPFVCLVARYQQDAPVTDRLRSAPLPGP